MIRFCFLPFSSIVYLSHHDSLSTFFPLLLFFATKHWVRLGTEIKDFVNNTFLLENKQRAEFAAGIAGLYKSIWRFVMQRSDWRTSVLLGPSSPGLAAHCQPAWP
jgi:hypothetical protein